MFAAGIFPAEKLVFTQGRIECAVIVEAAAHFGCDLGHGKGAVVGFGGGWSFQNHSAVRSDYSFVLAAGARQFVACLQVFALRFGFVELGLRP
jgi:hypothetical protein